jgi:hypothetical protein
MFVGDEVQVPVGAVLAAVRLAALAGRGSLASISQVAWNEGIARVSPALTVPGGLASARFREPVRHGAVTVLTLRWEAVGISGSLYPALDADITLVPSGEHSTLIGLDGVYRPPGGIFAPALDPAMLYRVAAATIRSLLALTADAIAGHHGSAAADQLSASAPSPLPAEGS